MQSDQIYVFLRLNQFEKNDLGGFNAKPSTRCLGYLDHRCADCLYCSLTLSISTLTLCVRVCVCVHFRHAVALLLLQPYFIFYSVFKLSLGDLYQCVLINIPNSDDFLDLYIMPLLSLTVDNVSLLCMFLESTLDVLFRSPPPPPPRATVNSCVITDVW